MQTFVLGTLGPLQFFVPGWLLLTLNGHCGLVSYNSREGGFTIFFTWETPVCVLLISGVTLDNLGLSSFCDEFYF